VADLAGVDAFEDVDVLMVRCQRCRHRFEDWDDIPPAA